VHGLFALCALRIVLSLSRYFVKPSEAGIFIRRGAPLKREYKLTAFSADMQIFFQNFFSFSSFACIQKSRQSHAKTGVRAIKKYQKKKSIFFRFSLKVSSLHRKIALKFPSKSPIFTVLYSTKLQIVSTMHEAVQNSTRLDTLRHPMWIADLESSTEKHSHFLFHPILQSSMPPLMQHTNHNQLLSRKHSCGIASIDSFNDSFNLQRNISHPVSRLVSRIGLFALVLAAAQLVLSIAPLPFQTASVLAQAQATQSLTPRTIGKFEQLGQLLPSPNSSRTASGAPGSQYWQQRVDYAITAELNDANQSISGSETITYYNNSPDPLEYVWIQLDQNAFSKESETPLVSTGKFRPGMQAVQSMVDRAKFDGGYKIKAVRDAAGKAMKYTIVHTMMRVELASPLRTGQKTAFSIDWSFNILPNKFGERSCYEFFTKDSNYAYAIAQWFPRAAVYSDVTGWQHKQFLGQGEFTLPFGDYKVSLTVPADFVVAATGSLQNPAAVLSAEQQKRLKQAETAKAPVMIVTPKEALENEKSRSKQKKTWTFAAQRVRDFAFACSRKFIWDALGTPLAGGKRPLAMSFYPKEGNPLWEQYSTRVVAHTLQAYSEHTIDYPYPIAISVNAPVGGMEYPMICFNGPRPEADGTYDKETKYDLISVIIHEVGHNFFPMIVNSDERQWTWMDEGVNSFMEYIAAEKWERDYPMWCGPAKKIVDYMKFDKTQLTPLMSSSDNIPGREFGFNGYGKPATALNILRETVMGRELFDYAFKKYAQRWAFKHPEPADFFRTMEDASGMDLDWFWRGWFFTVDNCDISIERVSRYVADTKNPEAEQAKKRADKNAEAPDLSQLRNKTDIAKTYIETDTLAKDYYDKTDPLAITPWDKDGYDSYAKSLSDEEKKLVESGLNIYELEFKNVGGLVMPVILELTYEDGTKELRRFPAEIWRHNNSVVNKVIMTEKPVKAFLIDPNLETADTDTANNAYPKRESQSRFQIFKSRPQSGTNPMQLQRRYDQQETKKPGTH
jgi:hypothetical protein